MTNTNEHIINCPKCKSDNVTTLEMAHKNGVKQTNPPSLQKFGVKGFLFTFLIALGTYTVGGFMIGFFGVLLFGNLFDGGYFSLAVTVFVPLAYALKRLQSIKEHNNLYEQKMRQYLQTWICLRCATCFCFENV